MGGFFSLLYGFVAYAFFLVTFTYAAFFVGGIVVPKTIDAGAHGSIAESVIVNLVLLALFAIQHTIMARRGFKRWWTRIVPPAVERSTFVLAATALLALLCWKWQPIPAPVIWTVEDANARGLIWAVFGLGWAVVLLSTFLLNHFELFGLRQVFARLTGREIPEPQFRTPLLYRYVRHPLYLGFVMAFWATPVMTAGHLLFAAGATGYILVGIWFEERDLIHQFGDRYRRYRDEVGMLLPWRKAR